MVTQNHGCHWYHWFCQLLDDFGITPMTSESSKYWESVAVFFFLKVLKRSHGGTMHGKELPFEQRMNMKTSTQSVVSWKLHEEFQLPLELDVQTACWRWCCCGFGAFVDCRWRWLIVVDACWCLLTFSKDSQAPCSEMHRGQCANWGASPTCTLTASVGSSGDDSVVVNPEPGAVWV